MINDVANVISENRNWAKIRLKRFVLPTNSFNGFLCNITDKKAEVIVTLN